MLIAEKDRVAIREMFGEMVNPVRLVVFTEGSLQLPGRQKCMYCEQTVQLAQELGELSDKLSVEVYNFDVDKEKVDEYGVVRVPAIAVVGEKDYGVRYYGIPAGYEFTALLEDIIDVSKGTTDLSATRWSSWRGWTSPCTFRCSSRRRARTARRRCGSRHKLAIHSDYVTADMVEAQEFPEMAQRYGVYGVPRTGH